MDKTTTWLVRTASIFIIILGFGYVKKPLGNKFKQLTSVYKESQTIINIRGISCSDSEEYLNRSDNEILSKKVITILKLFDKRNGELYDYDKKSNSLYKHLNYQLIRSKEDGDFYTYIGYLKDSFFHVDSSELMEGKQTNRKPFFKVNLKTLKFIPLIEGKSYVPKIKCRDIKLPNNIKIVSAEKIYYEDE